MNFNPDPSKQSQEFLFSRKLKKISVEFCRLNWSIVCVQTSFYNCLVHFREFYDTVSYVLIISVFYREKRRRSKQLKISWHIESF